MDAKRRSTFLDGSKRTALEPVLRTLREHLTTLDDLCTDDETTNVTQSVLIQDEFCTWSAADRETDKNKGQRF